ncbi:MAG: N-acetylmuramoyl-L-alanine amidase [Dermatophilaceae bacterium]
MRLISSLSQLAVLGLLSGAVAVGMPSAPVSLSTAPLPVAAHDTVVDLLAPGQVPEAQGLVSADRNGAWSRAREAAISTVVATAPTMRVTGATKVTTVTAPVVVVGVTWQEDTGQGASVQYRSQQKGRWSAWNFVDADPEHGPDPGSAEAKSVRAGSDPLVVTDATAVQVRTLGDGTHAPAQPKLMVVDPGASAAPSASLASASRPFIYSRARWGADERIRVGTPDYGAVKGAFVHHTVNANSYTAAQVPSIIRAIYAYHVKGRGWNDIGYNFLIDRFGRIWEGRYGGMDRPVIGAHTLDHNAYSFGASAIGNYDTAAVPSAVTSAFTRLIGWKAQLHQFKPAGISNVSGDIVKSVSGHRDTFSTTCPGRYLYAKLPAIRAGAAALVRNLPSLSIARDVDHQNHGDVLATNASSDLLLYSGTGLGTMSPPTVLSQGGWGGVDLVAIAGDWDGNGTVDVVARKVSTGQLVMYPGDGFGGMGPVRVIGSGWGVFDALVAPGDWSGDGRPDLIGRTGDGVLRLYPGNGRGGFGSPRVIGNGWSGMTKISALGDWTRDGPVDLIGVDGSGVATIYPGASAGRFGAPIRVGPGWDGFVSVSALGDETSDTWTDLLVVDKFGVAWIGKSGPNLSRVTWVMQTTGWEAVSVYSG